jgi:hypothetical protein
LGLYIGIKKLLGGGKMLIILHNGSNDGLLAGGLHFLNKEDRGQSGKDEW